ncbi:MAG: gliding motility-associated C-terminal domain-containing protein [Hyphomicrobiales bacterium]
MKRLLCLLILFLQISFSYATHQRAAEFSYKYVGGLTYEFTLISYTYTPSPINSQRDFLTVKWGDGSESEIPRIEIKKLPDEISYNKYVMQHTFPAPGSYNISMEDQNRNNGITNIPNSVNIPMYVNTKVVINPFMGHNNSVKLLNSPVDLACVNKLFVHNPGAFDPDGDSLSYKLVKCKGGDGKDIPGYATPKASNSFKIDEVTGDLFWDTPIIQGEYNIAIKVEEWRYGVLVGFVVRDMQIEAVACDNDPPIIEQPIDTCVVAGDYIEQEIKASDPNDDTISLKLSGGPFTFSDNPALADPDPAKGKAKVTTKLMWNTSCQHLRKEPYTIYIKAKDDSKPVSLVDYKHFDIRVIAPPIEDITAVINDRSSKLSWKAFDCNTIKGYRIYRRTGSYDWAEGYCDTGIPENSGYEEIAEVMGVNNTSFIDDNDGHGLLYGARYCYRITSILPDNNDGKSSEEVCVYLKKEAPIIIKASNVHDDLESGNVDLKWLRPTEINENQHPKPWKYILHRAIENNNYQIIASDISEMDTTYRDTDVNINIKRPVKYQVEIISDATGSVIKSDPASYIELTATPSDERINLNTKYNAPWQNDTLIVYCNFPNTDTFDSIGYTTINTFLHKDLINKEKYSYYIKAIGHYYNNTKKESTINYSNITSAEPIDNEPPCPPVVTVETDCNKITNTLTWNTPQGDCPQDIVYYQILFSATKSGEFREVGRIDNMNDTIFIHEYLDDVVGCYKVLAYDAENNASQEQIPVCVSYDECPVYKIPNYFTPNGDGQNDILYPIDFNSTNPRAIINKIDMQIFNRWGNIVFKTNNPLIEWDGKSTRTGQDVSTGVYFYTCKVFISTLEGKESYTLKGSITIFR